MGSSAWCIREVVDYLTKKGEKVVNMNYAAVDKGVELVREVEVSARCAEINPAPETVDSSLPE